MVNLQQLWLFHLYKSEFHKFSVASSNGNSELCNSFVFTPTLDFLKTSWLLCWRGRTVYPWNPLVIKKPFTYSKNQFTFENALRVSNILHSFQSRFTCWSKGISRVCLAKPTNKIITNHSPSFSFVFVTKVSNRKNHQRKSLAQISEFIGTEIDKDLEIESFLNGITSWHKSLKQYYRLMFHSKWMTPKLAILLWGLMR